WLEWTRTTHPDISYTVDTSTLASRVDQISSSLAAMDSLSKREVWATMATLNPVFNDAHIGLRLPELDFEAYTADGGVAFDAPISVTDDGVFIADDVDPTSAFSAGEEVVAVNGVKMADFIAWLTPRLRGESDTIRKLIVELRFPVAFWTYAGGAESYVVETVSEKGWKRRVAYDAARDIRQPEAAEPFSLSIKDNVAILRVASFNISLKDDFEAFAADAFAQISQAGVTKLVVDLRENGGGAHDVSDILMAYLTAEPHAATSSITARILPENQAFIPGSSLGDVVTVPFAEPVTPPADLANRFEGDVVLVVGPRTYSQAIVFAATAQDLGVAKIAGAPTDGLANQTGHVKRTQLENTGFFVQSPIYILYRASGAKGATPLMPDIPLEGRGDAVLDALIDG
ncbi:MAG: S41 family peptidase, partial [Pseudomonadota bacterium]